MKTKCQNSVKTQEKIPEEHLLARDSFERIQSRLDEIEEGDLLPVNVDIPTAAGIVLGAEPRLRGLRSRIKEELPCFNLAALDELEDLALGACWAHAVHAQKGRSGLDQELVEEAALLRKQLRVAARALQMEGLFPQELPRQVSGRRTVLNLSRELMALADLFTREWASIEGKTAIEPERVLRAAWIGTRLVRHVGRRRDKGSVAVDEPAISAKQAAFTCLVEAYDQVRRAVGYLRWEEGDADEVAPSIYQKSKPREVVATTVQPVGTKHAHAPSPSDDRGSGHVTTGGESVPPEHVPRSLTATVPANGTGASAKSNPSRDDSKIGSAYP